MPSQMDGDSSVLVCQGGREENHVFNFLLNMKHDLKLSEK